MTQGNAPVTIVLPPQVKILTSKLAQNLQPPPGVLTIPAWIELAGRYIHEDAQNIAGVDPAIDHDSHLAGHPATMARQCAAAYNQISPDLRKLKTRPAPQAATPRDDLAAMAACKEVIQTSYYWWGYTTYFNDCAVDDIVFGDTTAAAIAGVVAAVCPPCSIIAAAVGLYLAVEAAWLQWADQHCGNRGAYLNGTWVGGNWISTVC